MDFTNTTGAATKKEKRLRRELVTGQQWTRCVCRKTAAADIWAGPAGLAEPREFSLLTGNRSCSMPASSTVSRPASWRCQNRCQAQALIVFMTLLLQQRPSSPFKQNRADSRSSTRSRRKPPNQLILCLNVADGLKQLKKQTAVFNLLQSEQAPSKR